MKRKTVRKTPPAKPRATAQAAPRQQAANGPAMRDPIGALVAASAKALGLAIEPAWEASVKFNLQLILRHAALVDEFPLPDDAEPAPVFHA
jgi:hypothetical protein